MTSRNMLRSHMWETPILTQTPCQGLTCEEFMWGCIIHFQCSESMLGSPTLKVSRQHLAGVFPGGATTDGHNGRSPEASAGSDLALTRSHKSESINWWSFVVLSTYAQNNWLKLAISSIILAAGTGQPKCYGHTTLRKWKEVIALRGKCITEANYTNVHRKTSNELQLITCY